uniref:Smr domain-containing protein n=1 Tax=Oryza nivara TaxID=4536 RepID=A0A0E0FIQ9_ORYNI
MRPSKKKSKKKKPSPAAAAGAAAPTTPPAAADGGAGGESCSPRSETLTLAAAAAAAVASETESSSSCEASTCSSSSSAFNPGSSGAASTSSLSAFSSSASTASSSAAGDERRDMAWLLDAFGTATIDQVDSAYREAGGDAFLAAGILGSSPETQPSPPPRPPDLSPRAGSGGRKASRRPKKVAVAATGMVADVIGKGYTRPATSPVNKTNAWKGNAWKDGSGGDRKYSVEEAEQFLCSMLGDNSELGMGVVRDVLGQYGCDVEKALDALLDISGMSSLQNMERCFPNAQINGMSSPNIFLGNGLSEEVSTAGIEKSSYQFTDEMRNMSYNRSDNEHGFFWGELQRSYLKVACEEPHSTTSSTRSTSSISKTPQQVLDSLFKIPEQRTYEPSSMDWKKVVKRLQSFNSPITSNNQEKPKNGNGYQEFRTVAGRHYDTMKTYYQKAAMAYSKGEKSYASYLAEEGKHYRELARMEDERASREIFEARNKHITNTVTIDLHGQHVKQAMRLLKVHMMICVCMPTTFLRVITGCGVEGTGKGKIKRAVAELVEKEGVEWHEENAGTIVLRLGGPREYRFLEHDSDSD